MELRQNNIDKHKHDLFIQISKNKKEIIDNEKILNSIEDYTISPKSFKQRKYFGDPIILNQFVNNESITINLKKLDLQKKLQEYITNEDEKNIQLIQEKQSYLDKYQTYLNTIHQVINNQKEFPYFFFKDTYQYDNQKALRLGLNDINIKTLGMPYIKKSTTQQSNNSNSTGKIKLKKQLHPLEIFIFKQAIKYLSKVKLNCIILDFFARNDDDKLFVQDNYTPEIHTFILIKNQQNEFLILDPNSTLLSIHCSEEQNIIILQDFQSQQQLKISTTPRMKIYINKAQILTNDNQQNILKYRDCIDISIKLAYGLNSLTLNEIFQNIKSFKDLKIIQQITNNKEINTILGVLSQDTVGRIRQSSNSNTRQKINNILKIYSENFSKSTNFSTIQLLITIVFLSFSLYFIFSSNYYFIFFVEIYLVFQQLQSSYNKYEGNFFIEKYQFHLIMVEQTIFCFYSTKL